MEYFHQDYTGWDDNSPLPTTKEDSRKWLTYYMQGGKIGVYDIKPVAIKVYGDFAFVHYYYSLVMEKDGKKEAENGRWTDILMKQGTKWVMIGDNGGSAKKED
jgi:ketosteroid isomerase-like protein